ncbi:MAG: hypothetical protein GX267_08345 [Fibrobacter sp.]|jgi:N-acetyl-anhydromuramyl-L-alanine amidase AmpD|nr:hypothetical protein [Fibrobacter sp.]
MKIKTLLLDIDNRFLFCNRTIGERIRESGKQRLWQDRSGGQIDVIVIHYISAIQVQPQYPFDLGAILGIFCDFGVSSHYLIDRRGTTTQLVPEQKKAWHCGGSIMPEPDNRIGVNDFSIGIELMATEKSGFTMLQYKSLCNLCDSIEMRYGRTFSYVGHDQIAGERAVALGLRKEIKQDPGNLFDWQYFSSCMEKLRACRTSVT